MLKSNPGLGSGPCKTDCMLKVGSTVEVDDRDSIVAKLQASYVCLTGKIGEPILTSAPKRIRKSLDAEVKKLIMQQ